MSITVELPKLNGEMEYGITIGVDASLPEAQRLPILTLGAGAALIDLVKQTAAVWALDQFTDQTARELIVNGVIGLIDVGMICVTGETPDGDWTKTPNQLELTEEKKQRLLQIANKESMQRAVTVAIATKANYWLMNHHTGQGQVAGYAKKVLEVFYPQRVNEQVVSAAHSLGHFASTLYVLNIAGVKNLRHATPFIQEAGCSVKLSADAKLRFASMPAGTHRLAVAYESAKRLVRSVYAAYCPAVEDFASLPPIRDAIMLHPEKYHIGASYLTGQERSDYQDTDMNAYLGRLGTFITTLYKASTLAKSPHLTTARIESYDDYDADFKAALGRIQLAQAAARGKIIEEQVRRFETAPEEVLSVLKGLYKPQVVPPALPQARPTPGPSRPR